MIQDPLPLVGRTKRTYSRRYFLGRSTGMNKRCVSIRIVHGKSLVFAAIE